MPKICKLHEGVGVNSAGRCLQCRREIQRASYARHRERVLKKNAEWRAKNPELRAKVKKESRKRAFAKNPEKFRAEKRKQYRANVNAHRLRRNRNRLKATRDIRDSYVRHIILHRYGLYCKDVPPELIEFMREIIKIKRRIRNEKRL